MNLQNAKKVTAKMHELLDSCAEIDFLVEPFFIVKFIKSNYARVQLCEDDAGLRISPPHVSITVAPDDTTDNLEGDSLVFTYYDGDDTPFGPKHGLLITKFPEKKTVYWRKRNQDPSHRWHYNVLARGQINFRFTPDFAEPEFMSRRAYREFLRQPADNTPSDTAANFLKIDDSAEFLAEVAYLQYWNMQYDDEPLMEGINFHTEIDYANSQITIIVACDKRSEIDPITIIYNYYDEDNSRDVTILDDCNLVYQRQANQNELTEWIINAMANDPIISDGFGNPLFVGDPTNV